MAKGSEELQLARREEIIAADILLALLVIGLEILIFRGYKRRKHTA